MLWFRLWFPLWFPLWLGLRDGAVDVRGQLLLSIGWLRFWMFERLRLAAADFRFWTFRWGPPLLAVWLVLCASLWRSLRRAVWTGLWRAMRSDVWSLLWLAVRRRTLWLFAVWWQFLWRSRVWTGLRSESLWRWTVCLRMLRELCTKLRGSAGFLRSGLRSAAHL
ncbi:MAG TPA: hypothetical protein VGP63_17005 [Planctomycetaceae bacterium]|nr:hypothetical protein [Planctomycetaceae bacterium]